MVLGRGSERFRTFPLRGHKVRTARSYISDSREGAEFVLYRDCTVALVLDLRSSLKAVGDILDGILRGGVSLSRSLELTLQWDCILRIGPSGPLTPDGLHSVVGSGLGRFRGVVDGLHSTVGNLIHKVAIRRKDAAVTVAGSGILRIFCRTRISCTT